MTKEGARARLTEPLQLRAAPGKTIAVSWTATVPNGKGGREPFGACGMFVRLLSRTGAASSPRVRAAVRRTVLGPDDFGGGESFDFAAKGALDCAAPPATIAVLSIGRLR